MTDLRVVPTGFVGGQGGYHGMAARLIVAPTAASGASSPACGVPGSGIVLQGVSSRERRQLDNRLTAPSLRSDHDPRSARSQCTDPDVQLHRNTHLCRYLLRPPLATERLTESPGGQLLYERPHPRRDGATHLLLDPLELIEKLSVLIPSPRFHLLRFHGLLAPHAAARAQIIPGGRAGVDPDGGPGGTGLLPRAAEGAPPAAGTAGLSWATLLKWIFALDVLQCRRCGGRRRIVGGYARGPRLRELLARLGLGERASRPPSEPVE